MSLLVVLLTAVPVLVQVLASASEEVLASVQEPAVVISVAVSEVSVTDSVVVAQVSASAAALVVLAEVAEPSAAPAPVTAMAKATTADISEAVTTRASPSGEKIKTCLLLVELKSPD